MKPHKLAQKRMWMPGGQRKANFKKQEHRSFIDWFIAVPAKITKSGHQIEIKIYENHFYKEAWKELDRLIEAT